MNVPSWRINAAIASAVMERFNGPRVIDYEHQTLHKEANGQPAPAAGWITASSGLTVRACSLLQT